MESNQNQRKMGRGSKLLVCGCIFLLITTLISASGIGYLVLKDSRDKNDNSNNTQVTKVENTKDYSSQTIYEPKEDIVNLVSKVSPAVVTVVSKTTVVDPFFNESEDVEQGVGTGFFISEEGLLITNEHVVCGANSSDLTIITSENKTFDVESFVSDPFQDIAIVKVKLNGAKVTSLKFANENSKAVIGQEVIAIGNPLGVNPGSVTKGIVSGLGRNVTAQGNCQDKLVQKDYEGLIQTDAAINGGNSGGPLINLLGEVIGVNSATSIGANNISYAVPSERVVRIISRYMANNGKLTFPYIGVAYNIIDSALAKSREIPAGAFVTKVAEGSPAEKSGIKKGDIITKIDDKSVEFSLQATLNQYFEPNQKVKIEIYRPKGTSPIDENIVIDGNYITLEMTIGEKTN